MTEALPSELLEVGHVAKAHGVRGEVVVELTSERSERVAPGATLFTANRKLVVASARPGGAPRDRRRASRSTAYLVCFEGVSDRDAAEGLRGAVLRAEPIEGDGDVEEGHWVHELVGCVVVDADGTERGRVAQVEANPASDLLVLDGGALVPLTFVVAVTDGRIDVDTPPGLFD